MLCAASDTEPQTWHRASREKPVCQCAGCVSKGSVVRWRAVPQRARVYHWRRECCNFRFCWHVTRQQSWRRSHGERERWLIAGQTPHHNQIHAMVAIGGNWLHKEKNRLYVCAGLLVLTSGCGSIRVNCIEQWSVATLISSDSTGHSIGWCDHGAVTLK